MPHYTLIRSYVKYFRDNMVDKDVKQMKNMEKREVINDICLIIYH